MGSLPNLDHVLERRERVKQRIVERERARELEFGSKVCLDWRDRNLFFLTKSLAGPAGTSKNHRISPQQRTATSISITHHLPKLPVLNTASAGHTVLSATSSNNPSGHHHHYHHHNNNIIQPQSSNPIGSSAANRRRESANSSIGATSVRRLLTVNRGCRHKIPVHVRAKVIKNFIFLVIGHGLISATMIPFLGLQGSNSIWFGRQRFDSIINDAGDEYNQSLMSSPDSFTQDSASGFVVGPPVGIGSLLLSLSFLLTSGMCFLTTLIIKKMGHYLVVLCGYVGVAFFLTCHFLPSYYTLLPAYIILGIVFGPLCISKFNLIIVMANKLSCGQHECCNAISTPNPAALDNEEHIIFAAKPACSRDENIRRLARWFHAAQDLGIICGSIISSLLLTCAAFHSQNAHSHSLCINANRTSPIDPLPLSYSPMGSIEHLLMSPNNSTVAHPGHLQNPQQLKSLEKGHYQTNNSGAAPLSEMAPVVEALLNLEPDAVSENYNTNNHGERICGAVSCPVWMHASYVPTQLQRSQFIRTVNASGLDSIRPMRRQPTNIRIHATIAVYLILSVAAIAFTMGTGQFTNKKNLNHQPNRHNGVPLLADTLFFAGPLAYFIGTEQGYILADFMKAYVSCSIGPHMVGAALIGMGIMQLIASCTLSMLLRHTKRIVVIIAGFFFHACLLLVLSRWKPSSDDSALFYVIAAAWGVCNAVWETLLFALISLTHKNHMVEVLSPIQGIKFLAMGITFGAHGFVCEYSKIIVLAILLCVSVPPYTILEIRLEVQRKATQNSAKSILQTPTL